MFTRAFATPLSMVCISGIVFLSISGWSAQPLTRNVELVASGGDTTNKLHDVIEDLKNTEWNSANSASTSRSWNEYRIGDGVAMHQGSPGCDAFPGSIVCAYLEITDQPNNISALVEVLDGRSIRRIDSDVALVHARLGDGLCAMVDKPCRGTRSGVPDCWNNDEECWFDASISRQYAYSKHWYFSVVSQLQKHRVKTVHIVGDKFHWTRTPDPRHGNFSVDEAYTQSMARFFRQSGFGVSIHVPQLPDFDFVLLCSAQLFVQGGGGYSALVAHVVEHRGGVVIVPSKARVND